MRQIYLDYNASTPIAPEVREAMLPYLETHFGNPSTTHWAGAPAKTAVEQARGQVASLLGCSAEEITFTSGGSESNNHVLKGVFFALKEQGNHIITTKIEHPAIINPCKFLEQLGAQITYIDVDAYGQVNPSDIEKAISKETILISVMHANNEVGTLQPLAQIAQIAKKHQVLFHSDAAQSVGKVPTLVKELGVDFLTIAGHKLYAPKGVGALYIRQGISVEPFIHGAGHESGRRAGTENVIFNVGLGKACELAEKELQKETIRELRDYFWDRLRDTFQERVRLNGHSTERLPNTLHVSFVGHAGYDILAQIPEIAASTGSACHSGSVTLSSVLEAMGMDLTAGQGAVRFSLGRYTTKEELDEAIQLLKERI